MDTQFATCPYCGQVIVLTDYETGDLSQEEIQLESIKRCTCNEARLEQKKIERIKQAKKQLYCMIDRDAEIAQVLEQAIELIVRGTIGSAVFKAGNHKISINDAPRGIRIVKTIVHSEEEVVP